MMIGAYIALYTIPACMFIGLLLIIAMILAGKSFKRQYKQSLAELRQCNPNTDEYVKAKSAVLHMGRKMLNYTGKSIEERAHIDQMIMADIHTNSRG